MLMSTRKHLLQKTTKQPNERGDIDSRRQPASPWLLLSLYVRLINEVDRMAERKVLHGPVLTKVDLTSAVEYLTFQ